MADEEDASHGIPSRNTGLQDQHKISESRYH
jgi:hypothetical protein